MALRILIAENNITAQKMGMKILTAAGHDVVTVSNGLAAIKRMAESHPDILLLDVYLPGYGGVEICEKVKATPEMAHISVLLTAGRIEPFRAAEGIKARADGFIPKPFEAGELIAAVGKLGGRAHPEEAGEELHGAVPKLGNSGPQASGKKKTTELQLSCVILETFEHIDQLAARSGQTAAPPIYESDEAAPVETSGSVSMRLQGEEVCDVCGYVNRGHAFVCRKCDVPLPSSVMSSGGLLK